MIGTPIVIVGPIHNGSREHAALVARALPDGFVDATMFPDGGGDAVFVRHVRLCENRTVATAPGQKTLTAYRYDAPVFTPAVPTGEILMDSLKAVQAQREASKAAAQAPVKSRKPRKPAAPPPAPEPVKPKRKYTRRT